MASVAGPQRDTPAAQLLDPARQMCWRVPELALLLSDQAVALARSEGDRRGRLQAEALALFALNRLGRGVAATTRAIAAVRDAESAGEDGCAAEMRVELAWCARSAGAHDAAGRVLQPVLEHERVDPVLRAHALVAFAAVTPAAAARGRCTEALDEAERLYSACELNRDTVRVLRARGRAARAAHHRRSGEFAEAAQTAEDGLDLLRHLGDPVAESGEVHARLVLERVQALIELGQAPEATGIAEPVLNRPVRAAAADPVGWLGLAVATRTYLPDGDRAAAIRVLTDTVAIAERHRLDGLLAEALNALSHALEQGAEYEPALRALRDAYAADRRWRSAVHEARTRLVEEFPAVRGDAVPRADSRSAAASQSGAGQSAAAGIADVPAEPPDTPASRVGGAAERVSVGGNVRDRRPAAAGAAPAREPMPDLPSAREPESETAAPTGTPAGDDPVVEPRPDAGAGALRELPDEEDLRATDDVRDAARRLMETLTSRAVLQDSAQRPQAMPQPREPQEPDPPLAAGDSSQHDAPRSDSPGRHESPDRNDDSGRHASPDRHDAFGRHDGPAWSSWQGVPGQHEAPDRRASSGQDDAPDGLPGVHPGADDTSGVPGWAGSAPHGSGTDLPDYDSWDVPLDPLSPTPLGTGAVVSAEPPDATGADPLLDRDDEPGGERAPTWGNVPEHEQADSASGSRPDPDAQRVHDDPQPVEGRRSRGRSLAEIQASLQVFEQTGRRRSRRAEPDAEEGEPMSAADLLARQHDEGGVPNQSDAAPEPAGSGTAGNRAEAGQHGAAHRAPASDSFADSEQPDEHEPGARVPRADRPDEPQTVGGEGSAGDPPSLSSSLTSEDDAPGGWDEQHGADAARAEPGEVGLADLLTEALMAYESGRRTPVPDDAHDPDDPAGDADDAAGEEAHPDPGDDRDPGARREAAAAAEPAGRHSRSAADGPVARGGSRNATGAGPAFGAEATVRPRHGSAVEAPGRDVGARHRHPAFEFDPPAETSG
ncbi:hypothetical protein IQ251_08390 [Saccharopolyspora sp. HNM0983]|uniref:Tetratricopeptide repeat protein n=1 Tax=Saccharopolyspora montiporae TaxID=2781240 RepID=A0A929FXA4_9PSEU|nr:hypothetical protein [Saccharopolyspora sp. HNM0983]MBE9374466.1 hypothetical protein [Saccharopolyspora sp. HNM0983]